MATEGIAVANRTSFKPGHPGGPGRPRRQTERQYLDATIASVSLAAWRKIVRKAVEDAEAGDAKSREWLSKILIGDNPAVAALVDEMKAELEALRNNGHANAGGEAPAVGEPTAPGGGAGPGAGPAEGGPVENHESGGNEARPVAADIDAHVCPPELTPLFEAGGEIDDCGGHGAA